MTVKKLIDAMGYCANSGTVAAIFEPAGCDSELYLEVENITDGCVKLLWDYEIVGFAPTTKGEELLITLKLPEGIK